MLEQDLIELFEVQASEDQPPGQASIAAAGRHGRTRLNRRRSLSIAAPVLAAAAVLAVALSGTLAAPAPTRPASGQSPPAGPHEVPPLFFWSGWLPPGMKVLTGYLSTPRQEQLIVNERLQWGITAFSPGGCTLQPSKLFCNVDFHYGLDGSAGPINGFPAYWSRGPYWSGGQGLVFERAPNQWATASFPTHADELRVARHLTARVPAIRYPVQLTGSRPGVGLPNAGFTYKHGWAVVDGLTFGRGATLKAPAGEVGTTADVGVAPAGHKAGICGSGGRDEVIGGYPVVNQITRGRYQSQRICGYNVRGQALIVMTTGKRPFESAPAMFTHLRLFGLNPAKWPSTPFR